MNKFIGLLLALCVCAGTAAEPQRDNYALSGQITDGHNNEPLVGVTVYFPELSEGTSTDIHGHYSMAGLPGKKLTIQISYLGHQTIVKTVDLAKVHTMDFVMKESNAMISEVVVTGLTGRSLMKDSPTPVSIVGTDQLMGISSTNIIDALSLQPGVSQITTGGGISKPVIRGLGFNRLVVVNDGIRQEGNQWGDEHGIEVDPQRISSAEILKGPASLMYGSDAMAGVIIFHGDPIAPRNTMSGSVSTEYQTNNGLFDYSLNFKGNKQGFVWNARYSGKMAHDYKNKYDNYVLNSQFREQAANALLGLNKHWGYTHLLLDYYHLTPGIIEGERGDDYSYGKRLPFQQIHHYKTVSDNAFYFGPGMLRLILGYQQNRRQEFEESPDTPGLDMQLHTVNYDLKYVWPEYKGWKVVAGANGMWQKNQNHGEEVLIPAYELFDIGIFSTASFKLRRWTLSGGLRFDNRHLKSYLLEGFFDPLARNFASLSGSIGAVYAISDSMNFRLNMSRGFRAPNLSELSANGVHEGTQQYIKGNSVLNPEYSWQIDAGWDYSSSILSAQVSLFANFIDNYIFTHRMPGEVIDGVPVYRYIQGDARLLGGEVVVDLHPIERLHFQNSFSYVNSVQLHQPKESRYLPYTPAPRWTLELRYDIIRHGKTFDNLYASASLECDLRQDHYYAADGTETATPSYTLLNLAVGTDLRLHGRRVATLAITANNLLDRAYQNHLNRLKYTTLNPENGRMGIFNMGRNIGFKLTVPFEF